MTRPLPAAGPRSIPAAVLPRGRTSTLAVVTVVVLGLIGLVVTGLLLWSARPVPVVISALAASVTFPLLVALIFWLDRYEPEPARYRLAALVWGGTAAVVIGAGLSFLLGYLVDDSEAVGAVVWAPLTEEFGKGLFLILLVALRPRQLQGPLDGAIYAALVGVGFSYVEDTLYYAVGLAGGGLDDLAVLVVLRGVLGGFSHSVYSAMFGLGVGLAVQTRSPVVRVLAPLGGFLLAVGLHALWNGSLTFYAVLGYLVTYAFVMLPALGVLIALGLWAGSREGEMIRSSLGECVQFGFLHPAEIDLVARPTARVRARRYARSAGGRAAGQVMKAFQQVLVEMAFLHNRVRRGGLVRDGSDRMAALTAQAAALRPYLLWPPPAAPLPPPPPPGRGAITAR